VKKAVFYSCVLFPISLFSLLSVYLKVVKPPKGFALKKIKSYHEYHPKWDIGPPTKQQKALLQQIASQPFYYLGSEKECYAFVSQDEELILKFFKQRHMHIHSPFNMWPLKYIPHIGKLQAVKRVKNANLRNRTFMSYLTSYQRFADQTGVLYLHLNKTHELDKKVCIYPPKGAKINLDLDSMEFLIQKNAIPLFTYLGGLLENKEVERVKQAISSILDLIIARGEVGIANSDADQQHHIGFVKGCARWMRLDAFDLIPPNYPGLADFYETTQHLKTYLLDKHPELASFLDAQIVQKTSLLTPLEML